MWRKRIFKWQPSKLLWIWIFGAVIKLRTTEKNYYLDRLLWSCLKPQAGFAEREKKLYCRLDCSSEWLHSLYFWLLSCDLYSWCRINKPQLSIGEWLDRRMASRSVYDICRLQTADRRLQTADCRSQIADCKLNDTKNLPNKGDVIKNITSCESEKVAWGQGWYFCAKLHWPHSQDAVGYSSSTLSQLTRDINNCVDSLFFFDYCELIMTSSNAH